MNIPKDMRLPLGLAFAGAAAILFAQVSGFLPLILLAVFFYMIIISTSKKEYLIPLMLFFLPWSPLLKLTPLSISFTSITTLVVLISILFKKPSYKASLIVSMLGLFAVNFIAKAINGYSIEANYIMCFAMFFLFPQLYNMYSEDIDFENCAVFFSLGIILATIASSVYGTNPNILPYVRVMENTVLEVTRYCGFYGDPNFYSVQIVTAVGCMLTIISKKKTNLIINIVLTVILVLCGLTSVSKSYIMCIAVVFIIWLVNLMLKRPSKFVIAILALFVIAFVLLTSGILTGSIDQYMARFELAEDASSLTTGRSDIWESYLAFMLENPLDLFLGQGYTSVNVVEGRATHNTPIQILYQFGIVGTIFFVIWLFSFRKTQETYRKTDSLTVMLLIVSCFSMWLGLDMLFADDFFLIIFLFFIGVNDSRKHEIEEGQYNANEYRNNNYY